MEVSQLPGDGTFLDITEEYLLMMLRKGEKSGVQL